MSKKNIIILVITLVIIILLLIIYQSNFLFKKVADYSPEKNIISPITSDEENADKSSNTVSERIKISNAGKKNNEACVEIQAYALRMAESGLASAQMLEYGKKITELEKKYEVDSGSEYFNEYCANKLDEDELERIKEKMRELGSNIE